jgi:hypothetical protein
MTLDATDEAVILKGHDFTRTPSKPQQYKKKGVLADTLLRLEALFGRLDYCSSLVTSCWTLLAWERAAMPVWLRISYLDISEVAVE